MLKLVVRIKTFHTNYCECRVSDSFIFGRNLNLIISSKSIGLLLIAKCNSRDVLAVGQLEEC